MSGLSWGHSEQPGAPLWERVAGLHRAVFGEDAREDPRRAAEQPGALLVWAEEAGRLVGYKLGYERKPRHFYSWLGGVHPEHRRQGIGAGLMTRQHALLRARGMVSVRTKTTNRWRAMLILDLRHGFDVIGCYTDGRGQPRIILEKRLA